jgi:hypothetical protein
MLCFKVHPSIVECCSHQPSQSELVIGSRILVSLCRLYMGKSLTTRDCIVAGHMRTKVMIVHREHVCYLAQGSGA